MSLQGQPCWYELTASDPSAARTFYTAIMGWIWADSGTPGMDYRIARMGLPMVAGMTQAKPGQTAAWMIYFAVDNCDATADLAKSLGATIIVPPADIPNTGRFAMLIDPQGAAFALLQPLPGGMGGAFDQQKPGHGNWHEVLVPDPVAALAFYGKLFGWTVTRSMPMGPMTYHIFSHDGLDIGGAFAPESGRSMWKPYFGIGSAAAAKLAVTQAGGAVVRGPDEVPGGAFTLQCTDPDGVIFALVGPA